MPRVSIGLPVYNGERFIRDAMDSLLAQSYEDFELIISDNASTDATQDICRAYAEQDARIRYDRNESNVGAGLNFNRIVPLATGEYFKWAAHDDICEPDFLLKCVDVLDERPDVVLSYPRARVIDEHGKFMMDFDFDLNGQADKAHHRLRCQIVGHRCYEVFGLIRSEVLGKTGLIGNYAGGDAVMLVNLCLLGKFYQVPEILFNARRHAGQSTVLLNNFQMFAAWFNPKESGRIIFPYWRLWQEYLKVVNRGSLSLGVLERINCNLLVLLWSLKRMRLLGKDVVKAGAQVVGKCVPRKMVEASA